jgi:hypothetical protein
LSPSNAFAGKSPSCPRTRSLNSARYVTACEPAPLRERQPGLAWLLVTHHLEELPSSTSHALLLRDGRMVAAGAVTAVTGTAVTGTAVTGTSR